FLVPSDGLSSGPRAAGREAARTTSDATQATQRTAAPGGGFPPPGGTRAIRRIQSALGSAETRSLQEKEFLKRRPFPCFSWWRVAPGANGPSPSDKSGERR